MSSSHSMYALMRNSRKVGDTSLCNIAIPSPGPGQVLIGVEYAGVCGSDVEAHLRSIDNGSRVQPPVVLGHEGAGRVIALGPGVGGIAIGLEVVAETTYSVCQRCQFCLRGEINLCRARKGLGSGANGFFAPFTLVPHERIHPLPEGIGLEVGSIVEPLACAVHAIKERAQVAPGETIAVVGPGPIGILLTAVGSLIGARCVLIGTTHSKPRLNFAREFGLAETIDVQDIDFSEKLRKLLGEGADATFECTGKLEGLEIALDAVRPGGRAVVLGEVERPLLLNTQTTLLRRELTLTASKSSIPSSWDMAIELLPSLSAIMRGMITHRLPLAGWKEAFELVEAGDAIKVIFVLGEK
jgi:L-iditol 2-dehydrogenase